MKVSDMKMEVRGWMAVSFLGLLFSGLLLYVFQWMDWMTAEKFWWIVAIGVMVVVFGLIAFIDALRQRVWQRRLR